jgi:hypothetical protein
LQWYTASFRVKVTEDGGGGGGGGGGDYGDYGGGATTCSVSEIRNPIGADAFECSTTESGALIASVGCPEGMQAVSVSCTFFAAGGQFIPALGATPAIQGGGAMCAFPPREEVQPEWAAYPYAMLLECSYNAISDEALETYWDLRSSGGGSRLAGAAGTETTMLRVNGAQGAAALAEQRRAQRQRRQRQLEKEQKETQEKQQPGAAAAGEAGVPKEL